MQNKNTRPVTILTGFLGAGKTTFLNALMKSNPNTRFAIIENEIGQMNVDGMLISENYSQLIELQEGCLCCTLNDDLYSSLEMLYQRNDTFDELIIECTGLALPASVMEPFTMHPIFKKFFPLMRTVCIVDTLLIEDQIKDRDEALRQLIASDVVVLNKSDSVGNDYLTYLENYLSSLNPLAKIFKSMGRMDFPFEEIKKVAYNHKKSFFSLVPELNREPKMFGLSEASKSHLTDILTRTYSFDEEFNYIHLYLGLSQLVSKHADKIYRMKGIGFKSEEDKRIVFQTVGQRVDMDYGPKWKEGEGKVNTMVFIGKDIDSLHIEDIFKKILLTG